MIFYNFIIKNIFQILQVNIYFYFIGKNRGRISYLVGNLSGLKLHTKMDIFIQKFQRSPSKTPQKTADILCDEKFPQVMIDWYENRADKNNMKASTVENEYLKSAFIV